LINAKAASRAVTGFLLTSLIFVGVPVLMFFALFEKGVFVVDSVAKLGGIVLDEFVSLIVFIAYILAFWLLSFGASGYCAKLFLEWWQNPRS